jgi:hypothetical protein
MQDWPSPLGCPTLTAGSWRWSWISQDSSKSLCATKSNVMFISIGKNCWISASQKTLCWLPIVLWELNDLKDGWTQTPLFSWMIQFFVPWQKNIIEVLPRLPFTIICNVGLWPWPRVTKKRR